MKDTLWPEDDGSPGGQDLDLDRKMDDCERVEIPDSDLSASRRES
ncbi:MAG TPA: hypothetical protein VE954_25135 [Oligoflexus sp.]|nr:hypothetical protein [Oligoflexus sp.]HYX36404.1 hypothetical protein [Oligoflexus sp.]